jgi:GxxExxY protein
VQRQESKLLYPELTEKIIGVYYDVYNGIGQGFLESVYSKCMQIALTQSGLTVECEVLIPVMFRNHDVGQFRSDLLVEKLVLLELKAVQTLDRCHVAQVLNYLRATELEVGLLLNFGAPQPQLKRLVFENANKKIRVYPRVSAVGGPGVSSS